MQTDNEMNDNLYPQQISEYYTKIILGKAIRFGQVKTNLEKRLIIQNVNPLRLL